MAAIATFVPSGTPLFDVPAPSSTWYPVPALVGILLEALALLCARLRRMVLALVGIGIAVPMIVVWLLLWAILVVSVTSSHWTM